MARTKGRETKLVNAKTKSDSLRATVPSYIVQTLQLSPGDFLEWNYSLGQKDTIIVKVIRSKKE